MRNTTKRVKIEKVIDVTRRDIDTEYWTITVYEAGRPERTYTLYMSPGASLREVVAMVDEKFDRVIEFYVQETFPW